MKRKFDIETLGKTPLAVSKYCTELEAEIERLRGALAEAEGLMSKNIYPEPYVIHGHIEGDRYPNCWTEDGRSRADDPAPCYDDIINTPQKRKVPVWLNVYPDREDVFNSERTAIANREDDIIDTQQVTLTLQAGERRSASPLQHDGDKQ